jgi:hypothetical protein
MEAEECPQGSWENRRGHSQKVGDVTMECETTSGARKI